MVYLEYWCIMHLTELRYVLSTYEAEDGRSGFSSALKHLGFSVRYFWDPAGSWGPPGAPWGPGPRVPHVPHMSHRHAVPVQYRSRPPQHPEA